MSVKGSSPQDIVCHFAASVTVKVKNTVYAEDAARDVLKKNPDLWQLESMVRKPKGRS